MGRHDQHPAGSSDEQQGGEEQSDGGVGLRGEEGEGGRGRTMKLRRRALGL